MLAGPALAQSGGGYVIQKGTLNSSAHSNLTDVAGTYRLGGTVGVHDAGQLSGGDYALSGGFWTGAASGCTCQLYGDLYPEPGGDCDVSFDDILCVLNGFAQADLCPDADLFPCGGDGDINLDDILAALDAFAGFFNCPHPCAP
jgi:hypothetical protein